MDIECNPRGVFGDLLCPKEVGAIDTDNFSESEGLANITKRPDLSN